MTSVLSVRLASVAVTLPSIKAQQIPCPDSFPVGLCASGSWLEEQGDGLLGVLTVVAQPGVMAW